eukprot:gene12351-6019_t
MTKKETYTFGEFLDEYETQLTEKPSNNKLRNTDSFLSNASNKSQKMNKKTEIITDFDTFGEFLNEFDTQIGKEQPNKKLRNTDSFLSNVSNKSQKMNKNKEISHELDAFLGEFDAQHKQQVNKIKKEKATIRKEEIIKDLDTFGDFLGEFNDQHELDKTLNHQHKGLLSKLFHIHEHHKKEITSADFSEYLKKYSLNHMLQYPKLREYLKSSSQKTFCAENVDFYESILDFKKLKKQQERLAKANEIYDRFLALGSINEVNLSEKQKENLRLEIQSNDVSKSLFDKIEFEIQHMIKTENYFRFIHSKEDFGRMLVEHENVILKE